MSLSALGQTDKEEKMRLALGGAPSCQAGSAGRQLWQSTVSSGNSMCQSLFVTGRFNASVPPVV